MLEPAQGRKSLANRGLLFHIISRKTAQGGRRMRNSSSHGLPSRCWIMKLTEKLVAGLALPKGKAEAIVFDEDLGGFGLRLRTGGARTWIYQFKLGSQHRRITLGSLAALSPAQARKTAAELHAMVRLGRDPAGEKAEGRVRAAETMAAALQSYLPHQRARLKPRSNTEVERHLLKHCKPLHGLQLAKIDRRTVANRISAVAAKSGPIAANRTRASLAAFFAWGIREGLVDSNPASGTTRRPERSRDRVLSNDEFKAIWAATAGSDDYSAVVRLLALTGARAAEIAGLRWSEIVDDQIVLPPGRTKNARQHVIPIAPVVRAILDSRPRRLDRDFIFGSRQNRPLCGWSVLKAALDDRIRKNGAIVAPWTHHDLRRTFATRLAELGTAPHIIEALLNHVSGHKHGVAGVYNRAVYEREKAMALALWGEHVLAVVEGRASGEAPIARSRARPDLGPVGHV
jgi:integrase